MKKTIRIAFCVLVLCSLLLVGIANASNAAYPVTEYQWVTQATIDGKWTTASEWTDGPIFTMSNNAMYEYKIDFTSYGLAWLVETFGDNTNDTGDLCQICLDPDNSGGTTPQAGDFKIEIKGHTSLKVYTGTGTGWSEIAGTNELQWANTRTTSPYGSTSHWVVEVTDPDKQVGTIVTPAPPNGMGVFAYDASAGKTSAWPPDADVNVPNGWGQINNFEMAGIPEGSSLGVTVLLASVAVIVGSIYLRKRPKSTIVTQIKL